MIGVIPAAGKGTRLGDLGKEIPKSLVKIGSITLLEKSINNLKNTNVSKIIIIVGYKKEQIIPFLNSKDFGVRIETVIQKEQKGLAHAILQAESIINEPFIVQLPDNIIEGDFSNLISEFFKNNADFITFYNKKNKGRVVSSYLLENNDIKKIFINEDKGRQAIPLYIMTPVFFEYCKRTMLKLKEGEELRETTVMKEMIIDGRKVMAIEFPGRIVHITEEKDIIRAQRNL